MHSVPCVCVLFLLNLVHSVSDPKSIPSNCLGLSDGFYYLKLLEGDEYPIIYAKCSNEYLILDPSLDEDIKLYFNSFEMYHHAVAGPSNEYPVDWAHWFTPHHTDGKYLLSPDCDTCEPDHERQLYGDQTVYMMTGSMFGCFWDFAYDHAYDQDFDTYQCYYDPQSTLDTRQQVGEITKYPLTDASSKNDWDHSGVCAFNVRPATLEIPSDHESCTAIGNDMDHRHHLKPSIGTSGSHCICCQSTTESNNIEINAMDLKMKQQRIQDQSMMNSVSIEDKDASSLAAVVFYLYQSDFEHGTYRITKAGRYVVMEDILFNPHPSSMMSDVNSDMTAWRPHEDQQDLYPGASQFRGPYFMGFWAAITVETDDVILDLNDHSIAMDEAFYYQQRWFSIISLTSQYYLPGQGIGFFGSDPRFASNVIIKDGTLGLTSHHCIHGNFNKHVLIEHIVCRDFETHAIQLNGFDHVTIRNVEIGSSSSIAFLRGEYGHARALLPRLQKVADENPERKIHFDGREDAVTMNELIESLIGKMNLIFDFVYNKNEPVITTTEEQKEWDDTLQLFYNPSGLPNGASLYGIYLNTKGENAMSYHLNTHSFSSHAVLDHVTIHDMRHKMIEYIRVSTTTMNPFGSTYLNPLQAPYDATQMFDSLDPQDLASTPRYKGSIMTDILFALSDMTDNWDYLQSQLIFKEQTLPWAKGEDLNALSDNLVIGCNNDVMLQSGKGLMAIRMDGVQHAHVSNVQIYNLFSETPLGSDACGTYTHNNDGGHIAQKAPMQVGFSGNTVQGIALNAADNIKISDIFIHDVQSHTGDALGIAVWPSVNLAIEGDVTIRDINAGWLIPDQINALQWESRPNRAPMACGVLNINEFESYVSHVEVDLYVHSIDVTQVHGFVYCTGGDVAVVKTMIGVYSAEDDESNLDSVNGDSLLSGSADSVIATKSTSSGDHILIGTIIACSILFCGCVTMAYVAYVYCQHKKQQKDAADRAELLLLQVRQESMMVEERAVQSNLYQQLNYQSFDLNAKDVEEEEEEEEQQN
eukprot:163099_1